LLEARKVHDAKASMWSDGSENERDPALAQAVYALEKAALALAEFKFLTI